MTIAVMGTPSGTVLENPLRAVLGINRRAHERLRSPTDVTMGACRGVVPIGNSHLGDRLGGGAGPFTVKGGPMETVEDGAFRSQ